MAHSVAWMSSPIDARTARLLMLELLLPPVISKEKAKEKCVDTSCGILVKSSQARQGKSNQARRGLPALTTPPCLRGRLRTPGPLDPSRSSSSSSSTGRARALGGVCLGLGEDIVTALAKSIAKSFPLLCTYIQDMHVQSTFTSTSAARTFTGAKPAAPPDETREPMIFITRHPPRPLPGATFVST